MLYLFHILILTKQYKKQKNYFQKTPLMESFLFPPNTIYTNTNKLTQDLCKKLCKTDDNVFPKLYDNSLILRNKLKDTIFLHKKKR